MEGTRLHCAELGVSSDRTPVVLLHGLNDSHLAWRRVAPVIATDRRVLMLDLPGHGLSDRPDAGYELEWQARLVARCLDAMGVERADIVGHSFGGGVALSMLVEHSHKVRRLILVAAGGLGREVALSLRLASLPGLVETFGQRFMAAGTRLALRRTRARFSESEMLELAAMNGAWGSARAFARTVRNVIDWRGQRVCFFDRAHELAALPPIAVCWGECDNIIPVSQARAFARLVEGVELIEFPGCGHYLHNEEPAKFARAVRRFLDDPSVVAARYVARTPNVAPPGRRRESVANVLVQEPADRPFDVADAVFADGTRSAILREQCSSGRISAVSFDRFVPRAVGSTAAASLPERSESHVGSSRSFSRFAPATCSEPTPSFDSAESKSFSRAATTSKRIFLRPGPFGPVSCTSRGFG